jgi:hypothetical protein
MHKPRETSICNYVERMLEMIKYLVYFLLKAGDPDADLLTNDEIMDIFKSERPNFCQNWMIELGFGGQASTASEFDSCQ